MTGYNTIQKIRRVEKTCDEIGMRLAYPRHGWHQDREGRDVLSVMAKDDSLPSFSRDAELFVGTLEELDQWLKGIQWMHNYYAMLKLVNEKKIKHKEDIVRHDILIRKLKNEKTDDEANN